MFISIQKRIGGPEVDRLERLLTRIEAKWRVQFMVYIDSATNDEMIRRMANLIEQGRQNEAIDLLDSLVVHLATSVIPPSFSLAGSEKVAALANSINKLRPGMAVAFDPAHPRASGLQQRQQLQFIKEFTDEQRSITNEVLTTAFDKGYNPLRAATELKGSIGLTEKQWRAVNNYRRLLEENSSAALHRDLRDRRSDRSLQRAINDDTPLTPKQINDMVDRYILNYRKYRADAIARTESGRTLSEANREAFQQTVDALQLPDERIERMWNATEDERTRHSHAVMDGQKVIGMTAPYTTGAGNKIMYPGDPNAPAEETIQCRCVETQEIGGFDD